MDHHGRGQGQGGAGRVTDKQLIIAVLRELEAIFDKAWVSTSYNDNGEADAIMAELKRQVVERIKQLEPVE